MKSFSCLKACGNSKKGRTVAKCTGLATENAVIMPPVTDSARWQLTAAANNPHRIAQAMSFSGNHQSVRIDPQSDQPVGERCRDALAIALKADQAGG